MHYCGSTSLLVGSIIVHNRPGHLTRRLLSPSILEARARLLIRVGGQPSRLHGRDDMRRVRRLGALRLCHVNCLERLIGVLVSRPHSNNTTLATNIPNMVHTNRVRPIQSFVSLCNRIVRERGATFTSLHRPRLTRAQRKMAVLVNRRDALMYFFFNYLKECLSISQCKLKLAS